MANWFVALPVSAEGWFERLVAPPPAGIRRFHPDDLHLTIAFFGPVGAEAAERGFRALQWPLGPHRITLGTVVPMGNPRRYSALSALVESGREALEAAMSAARGAAWRAAGARPDERPAKAHLTLARPSRSATARERNDGLHWASGLDLTRVVATLDRVALYEGIGGGGARRYRIVIERTLGG